MCLAIPGRVTDWLQREPPFQSASVEFGGVRREVSMECVPHAVVGDYVLVHAGIAISRIDAEEAQRVLDILRQLDLDDDENFGRNTVESTRSEASPRPSSPDAAGGH